MPQLITATDDEMVYAISRPARIVRLAFGAVLLALTLAWPIYLLVQVVRVSVLFQETSGVVIESQVVEQLEWDRQHQSVRTAASAKIRYTYEINGRVYRGQALAPGLPCHGTSLVERFPKTATPTVYYNPREPSEAYLLPFLGQAAGISASHALCTTVLLLLGAASATLLIRGVRADGLRLNLENETYYRTRGFIWNRQEATGSFSDFKGLRFGREVRGSGRYPVALWIAALHWHNDDTYLLGEWLDQGEARAQLIDLLKKLDLPIVDPSTGQVVIERPERLDPGLQERMAKERDDAPGAHEPPPDLEIGHTTDGVHQRFVFPACFRGGTRVTLAAVFVALFGMLQMAGVDPQTRIEGGFLVLETLCLAGLAFVMALGGLREEVVTSPTHIERAVKLLHLRLRRQSVASRAVRDIWFDGIQIVIKSQENALRIDAAARARPSDKRWLAGALRAVVDRGASETGE